MVVTGMSGNSKKLALTRRGFAAAVAAPMFVQNVFAQNAESPRPNILWITCEDMGPHLGAYGDSYATTPNLDKLASKGLLYKNAWSNAPVCAPARTTIISGMYPPSTGSENMRSLTRMPEGMKMYPCYLSETGYYVTNNAKEDYNLEHTGKVWDESSNKAHWRNRKPGQPFFSIFNFTITHESQMRTRPHEWIHDPAKAPVPAYHPDTPEVRKDWAQYYDNISTMDRQAADVLKQLEADGLADDTIVFFYGDHGSGMPRNKRWPYNSGLQVPFLVHFPEKYKHLAPKDYEPGASTDRLVSFVDLAPTLLSLIGLKPPAHMQGHAFCGRYEAPEQEFAFGFRGRMDERVDLVRSVRDKRYVYIRNYMPHEIYGQHIAYMFQTPTTQVWKQLYDDGKLEPPKTYFWKTKPAEELYDLQNDPDEVKNLAGSKEHYEILQRLRNQQQQLAVRIRDVGFLPEPEVHSRSSNSTPYEVGHDEARYPLKKILAIADLASSMEKGTETALVRALADSDSAVRYWGAMGILMRGAEAVKEAHAPLAEALTDPAPSVRIVSAEALGRYGEEADLQPVRKTLLELADPVKNGTYVSILALNAIEVLGAKADPLRRHIAAMPKNDPSAPARTREYTVRLIESITAGH